MRLWSGVPFLWRSERQGMSTRPQVSFRGSLRALTRLELNLEASEVSSAFLESRQGPATELVPRFVDELLVGD